MHDEVRGGGHPWSLTPGAERDLEGRSWIEDMAETQGWMICSIGKSGGVEQRPSQ